MTAFFKEAIANYGDYARQAKRPNDPGLALAFFGGCIGITTDIQVDDPAIFAAVRQSMSEAFDIDADSVKMDHGGLRLLD